MMRRLFNFIGFSIYQLVLFIIVLPIVLYIIFSLSTMLPGSMVGMAESGNSGLPTSGFQAWLTGDGNSKGIINRDFGTSIRTRQPVADLLTEQLPVSLEL